MSLTDEIKSGIRNIDRMVDDMNATGGDTIYGRTIQQQIDAFEFNDEPGYRLGEAGWLRMTAYKARWEWHRDNPAPKPDPVERAAVVKAVEDAHNRWNNWEIGLDEAFSLILSTVKGL